MDWKEIAAVKEVKELTYLMWDKGWDEANGGNISYILTDEEEAALGYTPGSGRQVELADIPAAMRGRFVLTTATGSYFREVRDDVDSLLGIIYLPKDGDYYEIAYGLEGNRPSSEFPSHLAAQAVRLAADPEQRVVMHNHASNVLAMTHVGPTNARDFTRALWRIITEAMCLFPDGVGFVPWCVCGGQEIADKTNEQMKDCRIVIWQYHGVFTAGRSLHDAFGLLETVEKCCAAQMAAEACGHRNPGISDEQLKDLCRAFGLTPHPGYLD